jgi:hypothetical protein
MWMNPHPQRATQVSETARRTYLASMACAWTRGFRFDLGCLLPRARLWLIAELGHQ